MPPPRLDIHQHLWPEPFVAALARRTEPPALRRKGGAWILRLAAEPDAPLDLVACSDPDVRRATLADDGIDEALLCLSSPFGIEALPAGEAAWHDGVHAAVGGVVGLDQLVHGSDRPVLAGLADLGIGPAGDHLLIAVNPSGLLTGASAAAGARA